MSLAWLLMIINAFFALTGKDLGIALCNIVIVIFMALHIYFAEDKEKKEDIDG